jgi:hypothetical protein
VGVTVGVCVPWRVPSGTRGLLYTSPILLWGPGGKPLLGVGGHARVGVGVGGGGAGGVKVFARAFDPEGGMAGVLYTRLPL